jgi:signal transduction histidine kinase
MRWSIRQQVLVPIVAIQAFAVAATTAASVALVTRRTERQIVDRLSGVVDALRRSSFPLNEGVLGRMSELAGAQFVSYGAGGNPLASSTGESLAELPPLGAIPSSGEELHGALRDLPTVMLSRRPHFAALIRVQSPAPGSSLLVLYPEASWRSAQWESAQAPLVMGAAALALMAAATAWIAQRIRGRIRELEHQVARIAEGDFRELSLDRRAPRDELHDLAGSINRMCIQLRQMRQAIQQSERTQLLAQLAAGLAHQLRNALTGARMSIQLHLNRCRSPERDASLAIALRQLSLIEEQVRGLLTLGKGERRADRPTRLRNLLEEVATLVHPNCEHGRITLEGPGGEDSIIEGDESSLRAAALNLALNAIEAAGPGGHVALDLEMTEDQVRIVVSDDGEGPPAGLGSSLFEPFVTGKPEGVGLGLALAQHVARAHHGELSWVRDDGWTRFRLTIPRTVRGSEPNPMEANR